MYIFFQIKMFIQYINNHMPNPNSSYLSKQVETTPIIPVKH